MRRMNGMKLVKNAKAIGFNGPVIVISGFLENDARAEYEAIGVAAILSKPCSESELQALLRS